MSELVFITGATGFIGLHVLHRTLLAGHRVRAAIRTADGEQRILAALERTGIDKSYYTNPEKLSFVVVPDIVAATAYDNVLSGVNSIIHVASPLVKPTDNYERDLVQPAVNGTTNILNAALAQGNIRRIVITSSIVTLVDLPTMSPSKVYSEKDKATTVSYANPFFAYASSKILAHKAVYEFLAAHPKSERKFDVVTIHPSFVMGHNYVQTEYSDPAPGTNNVVWSIVAPGDNKPIDPGPETTVSVIDVADAHVNGLTVPVEEEDKVEEFLLATPTEGVKYNRVKSIVEADEEVKDVLGEFVFKDKLGLPCSVDVSKAETKLGIKFRSFDDQVRDIVRQQVGFYRIREVKN